MKRWLFKSEPTEFSIDDLERVRVEPWDGVRNYQVRNMLRDQMQVGDRALFYHSNAASGTGAVGVMEVVSAAYPDPTQFDPQSAHPDLQSDPNDPRWLCVDVAFMARFPRVVSLPELRSLPSLGDSPLVRPGNRLSIIPLTAVQYQAIIRAAKKAPSRQG